MQLAMVSKSPEAENDEAIENALLNGDTPIGTPKAKDGTSTPAEPSQAVQAGPDSTIVPSQSTGPDLIDQRVQQIFGKRRADDESGPETSPKVANIKVVTDIKPSGTGDNTDSSKTIATDEEMPPEKSVNNIDVTENDIANHDVNNAPVNNGVNNANEDPAVAPVVVIPNGQPAIAPVQNQVQDMDAEDEEWAEEDDQPENFPEAGFPMQIPTYPRQPVFDYRYRMINSTPKMRRVDHERAIVLKKCQRDPHTNRIPQEEYEAREHAEMALSLG